MRIEIVQHISDETYEAIENFNNLTIYHTKRWHESLQYTFGWRVQAILGFVEDTLSFFLPFISKYRIDFKKHHITLPLSHRIGIGYDAKHHHSLNTFIEKLHPLFPSFEIHDKLWHNSVQHIVTNHITILDLKNFQYIEELYNSFDYKSIRYSINRAQKNNIQLRTTYSEESFDLFYQLEVETRRRQGAPVYPKSFFRNLCHSFKDTSHLSVHLAFFKERPVSGAIFLHYKPSTIYGYAASVNDRDIKKLGIGEFILWSGIEKAFCNGMEYFDFGTTPHTLSNLKKYKVKWGGETREFPYTYLNKSNKPIKTIQRNRGGVWLVSKFLPKVPEPIFKKLSPPLLRLVV